MVEDRAPWAPCSQLPGFGPWVRRLSGGWGECGRRMSLARPGVGSGAAAPHPPPHSVTAEEAAA